MAVGVEAGAFPAIGRQTWAFGGDTAFPCPYPKMAEAWLAFPWTVGAIHMTCSFAYLKAVAVGWQPWVARILSLGVEEDEGLRLLLLRSPKMLVTILVELVIADAIGLPDLLLLLLFLLDHCLARVVDLRDDSSLDWIQQYLFHRRLPVRLDPCLDLLVALLPPFVFQLVLPSTMTL